MRFRQPEFRHIAFVYAAAAVAAAEHAISVERFNDASQHLIFFDDLAFCASSLRCAHTIALINSHECIRTT